MKNIEIWKKRARKLIARNSYAYLHMQQQTMSVPALSRLLEAIAKFIKHATAMSTILATEIFQARCDAVLAMSKILLDNSNHELLNAPINSKILFVTKFRKLPRPILRPSNKGFWHLLLLSYNKK